MPKISSQIEAASAYVRVLQSIQDCIALYRAAGIEPPELLRSFEEVPDDAKEEGDDEVGEQESNLFTYPPIPHPPRGMRPSEADGNWVPIPVKEGTPTTVALAILRANRGAMIPSDVATQVRSFLPDVAINSVYNALNRVADNGILLKSHDGFELKRQDVAGVIVGKTLWAPIEHLMPTEATFHRREAILQIIKYNPKVQLGRIVSELKRNDWVKAKGNKDTVKLDMLALEEKGEIRRVDGSRKWELAKEFK